MNFGTISRVGPLSLLHKGTMLPIEEETKIPFVYRFSSIYSFTDWSWLFISEYFKTNDMPNRWHLA